MAWGHTWRGYHVCCRCDNQAVTNILASRRSRNSPLMHLLRCLFFFEAYYDLYITALYLPGLANTLADDLSRNWLSSFFTQAPHMQRRPSPLPLLALDLHWTQEWTGHPQPGSPCSRVLFSRHHPLHQEILQVCL